MFDTERFKEIIQKEETLHPNDDYGAQECWKELTDLLAKNIDETIDFINNECTEREFFWLSEILDDVVIKTQSHEFIDCVQKVAIEKFPEISKKYHIQFQIDYAKDCFDD